MTTRHGLFSGDAYGGFGPPLARSTDPVTSLRAAARQQASGKVSSGAVIILSVLRRVGQPLTYREIWSACTDAERAKLVEPSTICKRLKPMERSGLVRPGPERACTAGGAPSREWELVGT